LIRNGCFRLESASADVFRFLEFVFSFLRIMLAKTTKVRSQMRMRAAKSLTMSQKTEIRLNKVGAGVFAS